MRESRPQRGRGAERDEALGLRWAIALSEGVAIEEVEAQIVAMPIEQASAGIRALGWFGAGAALPLLARLAASPAVPLAGAAAEAMGDVRSAAAAQALDEVARTAPDKSVQKAARRSLHRLSSQGVRVEPSVPSTPVAVGARKATLYRVVASAFDGTGTRALWFAAERPLGGIYLVAVTIDDVEGLTDCVGQDTTRKRFAEREAAMREKDPMAWVELPPEYGRQLVQEAVGTARQAGAVVPSAYPMWAHLIDNPEEPFDRALVYREISALEARLHPTLEGESARLFAQPEVEPWFFPPEQVRRWARELAEPPSGRLILRPETEEQRVERLVREAVRELLPPRALHGLRRRLEETAYIFLRTDREVDARRAVAAAATIEDERPLQPPHPFVRALLERSLRIALEVERSTSEPKRLLRVP